MRPAHKAALVLGAGALAFIGCFADAARLGAAADSALAERSRLVAQLRLTDLALFTEARYTRHPSQADLHSAFQDHPLALEHFPSGSLVAPPVGLRIAEAGAAREVAP
mgnify:CR=1 FL=1